MGVGAGIVAGVGGIAKTIMGGSQASKARKAIENYQRQELQNVYEGVSVSTMGADLQREEMARAMATGVQALQTGGVRGLVGGLGKLQQGVNLQARQIGADLDQQQQQIDMARAADQARIQQMQERREEQDLAGLGQQLSVGQQNMMSGIGDIAGAAGSIGGLMGGGGGAARSIATPVSEISASGPVGMGFSNPFITG